MSQVIVVGAGNWGKNLVRTFHEINALAGIAEMDSRLREQMAKTYPDVAIYSDYQDVLASEVPAVVIATPVQTHFVLAKKALETGKDVYIEKPMTYTADGAEELIELVQKNNRILMVGHLLLYHPAIQKIKELVDNGTIGAIHGLHQERLKLGRVRSFENVLWSFGVHDLAVILYLIGDKPQAIKVSGQSVLQPEIEDDVYVHLSFAKGVHAHLHASWLWPELRRKLTVVGSKGMLVYDEEQQTLTLHHKGVNPDLSNRDQGVEVVYQGEVKPLTLECMHFLECVRERRQPISDGQNGLEVVKILEKASCLL